MAPIDVVKWDSPGTVIAWKHPGSDLSTMTQLIVNESQAAILFKNGQRCDVFGAGRHTLSTQNIPLLNKIVNLPFGGRSPFAAEVWFVNQTIPLNLKFGTPTPIQVQDPVYEIRVPVRAFGQFGLKVEDPAMFVHKLIGANIGMAQDALVDYFKGILTSRLKSRIAQVIVREKIGVLEIETMLDDLSRALEEAFAPDYAEYGLGMRAFRIMSISIPEDHSGVQELEKAKAAAKRRQIEGISYDQERSYNVLQTSAANEGAGGAFASIGAGLGMGRAMGQMGQQFLAQAPQGQAPQGQAPQPGTPPPPAPPPFGSPPPFTPPSPSFYVMLNGQQQGPYTIDDLRPGVPTGQFTAETPVWTQGMPNWLPAGQVPQLMALFAPSGPPPFGS
jgi:membrane protease subunit (stomatin/prohibitin family)